MSSKLVILAILFFIIATAIAGWAYFSIKTIFTRDTNTPQPDSSLVINTPPLSENSQKTIHFPVNPDDPDIESVWLTYRYQARIEKIEEKSEGLELIMDIKSSTLPRFVVGDKTIVFVIDKNIKSSGGRRVVDRGSLKAGQSVWVTVGYNLIRRIWFPALLNVVIQDS